MNSKPTSATAPVQPIVMRLAEQIRDADLIDGEWVCGKYPTTAHDAVQVLPRDAVVDDCVLELIQLLDDRLAACRELAHRMACSGVADRCKAGNQMLDVIDA